MYLLDANVFMTAANTYYAFDLAPSFWAWLKLPRVRESTASITAVRQEVTRGSGALVAWAKQLPSDFWIPDDEDSLAIVGQLAAWSSGSTLYQTTAVSTFMASADIRLIATAAAHGDTVVTHETPEPQSKKRIKIPDACDAFHVPCIRPFAAFRELGMSL